MNDLHQGVGIIGAGLVGCLSALAFAAKGYSVTIFELRDDPSALPSKERNLRSINLAVSDRGIRALNYVDKEMANRVLENVIPMYGRMIHDLLGNQESQQYGLFGESINSIDRSFLNDSLLDEIKRHDGIKILFNHKLVSVEGMKPDETPKISLESEGELKSYEFDFLVGADGAHSQFRYQLQKSMRMNFTQNYIDMQYLELSIPPREIPESKKDGEFHFSPNHLHIWPRTDFMLIALANKDGSFTCTFFSPWSVIENITNDEDFLKFFQTQFKDAVDLIGADNLRHAFKSHPRGSLMQVSVYPYHHPNGKAILIGDAAHLMVPFYGQGMNCGFEDVQVLMELIDQHGVTHTAEAFQEYSIARKDDLDSICKLALDNYYEMSHKVTDRWYLLRKNIDYALGKFSGGVSWFQWIPMYTMISFRGDIPYSKAVKIEQRQRKILQNIELGTMGLVLAIGAAKAWQYFKR